MSQNKDAEDRRKLCFELTDHVDPLYSNMQQ